VTEQPTRHPGPSEETRPGQRTVLVVDLDGEPLAPLRALEEILLWRCLKMDWPFLPRLDTCLSALVRTGPPETSA